MNAKFLSENQKFEFTKENHNALKALVDNYYPAEVNRMMEDYFRQGKRKYIKDNDLKNAEAALLLQRAINSCCDTFTFTFGEDEVVDLTFKANISLIKKISKSLNIPYEIPLFIVAKNAIKMKQPVSKIKILEENGLNTEASFIINLLKDKNHKLINFALSEGNISLFKYFLDANTINNDPGVLTSIPLTSSHPLLTGHSDTGFLSYYFCPDINSTVKEMYKNMAKVKQSFFHDYLQSSYGDFCHEEEFFTKVQYEHQLHKEIEKGTYDGFLKLNNVDNMLMSAFIDLKYIDNEKKYFKELLAAFKEKNINISAKQKEAIMYILIHKDKLHDEYLPWKLNINNKKSLIAILETLKIYHKDDKLGSYRDPLIFKYLDDFKEMIHKESIRKLIEKSMTTSIKNCINGFSNSRDEDLKPIQIFNEFFEYPVYKILIESEYKLSDEFKNMLREELEQFEHRGNKPFEESIKIIANNIDMIIYNSHSTLKNKKRI